MKKEMTLEEIKVEVLAKRFELTLHAAKWLIDNEDFIVLTDAEADEAVDNYLDDYIDDVIMSEIPEIYHGYFDGEAFKQDAILGDGRGHFLAGWDGIEHEETWDGETYFIYQQDDAEESLCKTKLSKKYNKN